MPIAPRLLTLVLAAALAGSSTVPVSAQALRIALQDDPDRLDPAQGGTFVGRIVFAALCDKLIDIDANLKYRPQLATQWDWSEDGKALVTLTAARRDQTGAITRSRPLCQYPLVAKYKGTGSTDDAANFSCSVLE